ncbi:MAG TPA: hypothetical protein VJK54_03095 [Chthoniobacterales bacterium]|nr:hypothetical protein [Chthoniobacterales bacterium]
MITSLDGKRKISIEEFDRLFDDASDEIDEFVDWTQSKPGLVIRPGQKIISRILDNEKIISEKTHIMGSTKAKKNCAEATTFDREKKHIRLSPIVAHA